MTTFNLFTFLPVFMLSTFLPTSEFKGCRGKGLNAPLITTVRVQRPSTNISNEKILVLRLGTFIKDRRK